MEGTSFVVQVEGTSTWVVVTENKRGYISCGSVQVEGAGRLGTGCRHGLLSNQYKFLGLFSSSLHSLISVVHF